MSWEAAHALADRLTPHMRQELEAALRKMQGRVKTSVLLNALKHGTLSPAEIAMLMDALPTLLHEAAQPAIRGVTTGSAEIEAKELRQTLQIADSLSVVNPAAVDAARQQGALLVTRVSEESRQAIRSVVAVAIDEGVPVEDAARLIRLSVGLNEGQAMALYHFRARLLAAGGSESDVAIATDRYASRLLRQRASMIARTELIDASTRGQRATWERAQASGLISHQARMQWIVTPDDRLCDRCRAMSGKTAPVGGFFATAYGPKRGPTLHPYCRCALRLEKASLQLRRAA